MSDVIFDIDGTLADIEYRRHFVATKPKNWKAFFEGMENDPVNEKVKTLAQLLFELGRNENFDVLVCSGRPADYRKVTEKWLQDNNIWYTKLYMRAKGDNRADDIVKQELLQQMRNDGFNPTMAFDDRKRVIDMWIRNGIFVFDVSQGKGDF